MGTQVGHCGLTVKRKIPRYEFLSGTREITRLDIMTYLDPASNPGSKPQRFDPTN